jgi:MFS transporter, DHA1 family, tetracycline resistance protein
MGIVEQLRGKDAVLTGNFLLLMITWVLMYTTQPIPDTYSSLYYQSLGASPFLLSIMFFIGALAVAVVQFPGGYLADKHGHRWLIATMSFGLALGYVFYIFAPSWHFIVLGMVIQNLALIYSPALMAMMMDSLEPTKRGTGMNFQTVIVSLISLPAPLIAAAVIMVNGEYSSPQSDIAMRLCYAAVLVAYLVSAVLRFRLKETLPANGENGRPNILQAFKNYPQTVRESWQVWSKVPKSAYYLFITTISINSLVSACQIFFVIYATDVLKISGAQYALAMAFMYLSVAVPAMLAGVGMDLGKDGRKRFLLLGFALYVPAMLLFAVSNFYLLLVSLFLFGFGNMLRVNVSQVMIGDMVPREMRGKVFGFVQFFLYLASAIIYLIAGFLYEYVAPWLPFVILAAAAIPLTLIVALKISEPTEKQI